MKLDQFSYELPPELIAKAPLPNRRDSRLLHLNGDNGSFRDGVFSDLIKLIEPGDLIDIDIPQRRLTLRVDAAVLQSRREAWRRRPSKIKTGYLARYASMVTSADQGAILRTPE